MAIRTQQCPNCSAEIAFDPALQKSRCEYCRSEFTVETDGADVRIGGKAPPRTKIRRGAPNSQNMQKTLTQHTCPSCGAQIIIGKGDVTARCHYCHKPLVISERVSGAFKPAKVIPFQFDKDSAYQAFLAWCGKRRFLPGDFAAHDAEGEFIGIYIPCWLHTCEATGTLNAKATQVTKWREGDLAYEKTSKYAVAREAALRFEDIPYYASNRIEPGILGEIGPFDPSGLKDFSAEYLAGFQAEACSVESGEALGMVWSWIEDRSKHVLRESAKIYSSLEEASFSVARRYSKSTCVLVPLFVYRYSFRDKTHTFAINGQTSKMCSSLPLSLTKLSTLFAALFFATVAIATWCVGI